jgi:hypothetical protein
MLIVHKPRAVNVGLLQIQIFNVLDGINIGDYDIPVTIVEYNLASIGFSWKQESHRLHRSLRIDMIGDIRGLIFIEIITQGPFHLISANLALYKAAWALK